MQGHQDSRNLSRTLQESLSEVLREVEGNRMGVSAEPPVPLSNLNFSRLSSLNFPGGASSSSFLGSSSFACFGGATTAAAFRPSETFGLTTEELLRAAAIEKRMLDQSQQQQVLARQQAMAEKTFQSRLKYNESLLQLMKGENPSSSTLGLGGLAGTNNLLQQSYQQMFKQPPVVTSSPIAAPATASLPPTETKTAIKVLGTSLRKKDSQYIDVSVLQDPDISDKRTRGGVTEPFPEKLHRMLREVEQEGKSDVIGFFAHGRAFAVHDPDRFITEVMPKYFKQSRLSSFQRQLNLYGFTRISSGPDAGGYYHELFLKGRPNLVIHMRRVGLPQGEDRRKMRAKNVKSEPNFYAMGSVDNAVVKLPGML